MRKIPISSITPSQNNAPGVITVNVGSDLVQLFHGQEWIDELGTRYPFYQYSDASPAPVGTTVLVATVFDIVDNPTFCGRYTVYTKKTSTDYDPTVYNGGTSVLSINVNEAMPNATTDLSTGSITHIGTYLLTVTGESSVLVLEQADNTARPVELLGRLSLGWGEVMMQNMLGVTQSWASTTAPSNPFMGQLWFDTVHEVLKFMPIAGGSSSDWQIVNQNYFGQIFRFHQAVPTQTWTIAHGMNLPAPYIASCSFFVDTISGVKSIIPSDVTFIDPNTASVTFTNPSTGYAVLRS